MNSPETQHAEGDRVELRGLRVMCVVGVLKHERQAPQPLEVDVDIYTDVSQAASSDSIEDALDYAKVAETVAEICETAQAMLLERLAVEIAVQICALGQNPGASEAGASEADAKAATVTAATVTVRKLRPPVPLQLESAGVRVTRFAGPPTTAS